MSRVQFFAPYFQITYFVLLCFFRFCRYLSRIFIISKVFSRTFLLPKSDCLGLLAVRKSSFALFLLREKAAHFNFLTGMSFADAHSCQNPHFGHFKSNKFRHYSIRKSWIASGFRPRNDIYPFRPNVLLKGSYFAIKKRPMSVFKKLGWLDSNQRDGGTKNRCLTTWRHPNMCHSTSPILLYQTPLSIFIFIIFV